MLPGGRAKDQKLCYDEDSSQTLNKKIAEYPVFNRILKETNCAVNGSNGINSLVKDSNNDFYIKEQFKKTGWQFTRKDIIWRNVIVITLFHIMSLYAYLTFPYFQRIKTLLWGWVVSVMASFGVGAGVHRLWTHRSYKAKTPLRIILLCCYSIAGMIRFSSKMKRLLLLSTE